MSVVWGGGGRLRSGIAVMALAWATGAGWAQNLLPNPGFEAGTDQPAGWHLAEGAGRWNEPGYTGHRALTVQGTGEDSSVWRTAPLPLGAGRLFCLRFYGRRLAGASGGTGVAGTSRVNRDFPLTETWSEYRFIFITPTDLAADYARLGQWHLRGQAGFDDAQLAPVEAVSARFAGGLELGEGESIREGVYRFHPDFNWEGANYHRPLATNRAGFNSNRWLFSPGAEIVYRHRVSGWVQQSGKVHVQLGYYQAGRLRIEASRDGQRWVTVGEFDGQHPGGSAPLPATLFPADEIQVRLAQAGPGAGFQLEDYAYEAPLAGNPPAAEGATHFLEVTEHRPGLAVEPTQAQGPDQDGVWRFDFRLVNQSDRPLRLQGESAAGPGLEPLTNHPIRLAVGQAEPYRVTCRIPTPGDHEVTLALRGEKGTTWFLARTRVFAGFLDDRRPGYLLATRQHLAVWWCESGWKVGRDRGLPPPPEEDWAKAVSVTAARGEYEAAQVVLRPAKEGLLSAASVIALRDAKGAPGAISVRLERVAYVHVTRPTDATCRPGWYPDPLPLLRAPVPLHAGENQPLWVTFHVAPEARAGDYEGKLQLHTSLGLIALPLTVHVYDFTLPSTPHLKSALGLGTGEINRYHRLTTPADKEVVFAKYLRNFAEHRISPYSFYDYAPITVGFVGAGTDRHAVVDFSRFDVAAAEWLDRYHFSTFVVPLEGMGGGTFQSRRLGVLDGYREGTPEHARLFHDYLSQVEEHLRQRGWLDRAFTYWFDEPAQKDFAFVVAGMDRLKAAAPGLKRMLTKEPEPELLGHVDIWCGLTPEWTPARVKERQARGEEVWWYICTGPKAPYVTEFIDHPGTELRLWPWQSWQYGVNGILIWATTYWNSPLVYRAPAAQDPWRDPMSWVSGYDYPVGFVSPWGNGDGRFLYPPERDPNTATTAVLEGPVNSMRWEALRDGMEDYEYLWLLNQALRRAEAREGNSDRVKEARQLLVVPPSIATDLTHFTTDPRPLLTRRDHIARMIERLTH